MPKAQITIVAIMLLVACLTGFSSDIYIPSFFNIALSFDSSVETVQRTMSIFMFAVALSQLIYGPASEIWGRRIPLITGLVIVFIGSILCFYSSNIDLLLAGRFIQGFGAGACACLWRSIFRDSFDSTQMSKFGGYLGIIMVLVVSTSPALGGYLDAYFGWRAAFFAIIAYALITLLAVVFFLNETSIHYTKDRMKLSFFKDAFSQLLSSPIFMGYSLCVSLTYGAFFSWFVMGPLIFIRDMGGTSTAFGLMNLFVGSIAMILGGLFNGKMVTKLGKNFMLRCGWGLIFLAGMFIICLSIAKIAEPIYFVIAIFTFLFGVTLIWPNTFAEAFAPFGHIAGCAATLYSCFQLGGGALISWLCSFIKADSALVLALIFILVSVTTLSIFEFGIRKYSPRQKHMS